MDRPTRSPPARVERVSEAVLPASAVSGSLLASYLRMRTSGDRAARHGKARHGRESFDRLSVVVHRLRDKATRRGALGLMLGGSIAAASGLLTEDAAAKKHNKRHRNDEEQELPWLWRTVLLKPGLLFLELPFRTLLVWRLWREPVRRADLSV